MVAEVGHIGEGTAEESQERVERAGGGEDGEKVEDRMWRGVVVESDVESGPTR
jgi:hypothetical protein